MTGATPRGQEHEAVVEELTFDVAPDELEDWLAADQAAWDDVLAGCPGFLGKEVWVTSDPPGSVRVVVWWASRDDQERVPDHVQDQADRRMGDLVRQPGSRHLRMVRRLRPRTPN